MSLDQLIQSAAFDNASDNRHLEMPSNYNRSTVDHKHDKHAADSFSDAIKEQSQKPSNDKADTVENESDDSLETLDNNQTEASETQQDSNTPSVSEETEAVIEPILLDAQMILSDEQVLKQTGPAVPTETVSQDLLQLPTQLQTVGTANLVESTEVNQSVAPVIVTDQTTKQSSESTGQRISANEAEAAELLMPQQHLNNEDGQQQQQSQQQLPGQQIDLYGQQQKQSNQNQLNTDEEVQVQSENKSQGNGQLLKQSNVQSIQGSETGSIPLQNFKAQLGQSTAVTQVANTAQEVNAMDKAVGKQIERAMVQQISSNQKVLQIRLTPPELGTVRIEILEQNGRMSVRLQAEDDSVRMSLERMLPQLRSDIRAGNAPVADIQLTDQAFFMNQQRHAQQQQQRRRQRDENDQGFSIDGLPRPEKEVHVETVEQGITINKQGVNGLV